MPVLCTLVFLAVLSCIFQEEDGPSRQDLFEIILKWNVELDLKMAQFKTNRGVKHVEEVINTWLWSIRMCGQQLAPLNNSTYYTFIGLNIPAIVYT